MEDILKAIISKTETINDRKHLPCPEAFKIAEEYKIALADIGNICNENKIKIYKCQLGCF